MGDTITVTPEPSEEAQGKDNPEYMDKMVEKAEAGTGVKPESKDEALLAGKYKTREELVKAINELKYKDKSEDDLVAEYKELESGIGKGEEEAEDDDDDSGDDDSGDDETGDDETDDDDDSGDEETGDDGKPNALSAENINKYNQEVIKDGKLSDESYTELEKAGYNRDMVDTMIDGIKARINTVFDQAGSEEAYWEMIQWADQNYSQDDKDTYNEMVNSGKMSRILSAVDLLKSRYEKANGTPPKKRVEPKGNQTNSADAYQSWDEAKRDMSNPEYDKNPAFRKSVRDRIRRSNL